MTDDSNDRLECWLVSDAGKDRDLALRCSCCRYRTGPQVRQALAAEAGDIAAGGATCGQ